jgi:hypothetical protein
MLKEMEMDVREKVKVVISMNKIALAKFFIPWVLACLTVLFFWLFVDPAKYQNYISVLLTYSLVPVGGAIVSIPAGLKLPPQNFIAFVVYTDGLLALFLVWNFDYAKKIPGIGQLVARAERRGVEALEKYKWARRLGFLGVTLLVIFPFVAGSAIGSVVGRIIGLPPFPTFLAVIIGTFVRSTILIYSGWFIAFLVRFFL